MNLREQSNGQCDVSDIQSTRKRLINSTYNEAVDKLRESGKCIIVRPTGYGKTFILAHITRLYKHVMYMYPLNIIKQDVLEKYKEVLGEGTEFMSYTKLVIDFKNNPGELIHRLGDYNLIICDEAHTAGAENTATALKAVMEKLIYTDFLGATATPYRTDMYDVVGELFDNKLISDYTLHDAIQDGLIVKPYYVYSMYSVVETIKGLDDRVDALSEFREGNKEIKKKYKAAIKTLEIEMGNKLNASDVIQKNITQVYEGIDYMKFIVFFSAKDVLSVKNGEVFGWFKRAFPSMKVRALIITSDNIYNKNIGKLSSLKRTPGVIDLIFCIDMLNMGYHIDDLTGVVMLRSTSSNIIYKQQLGRCLSVASTNVPIIFDFVNNINKGFIYSDIQNKTENKNPSLVKNSRLNDIQADDLIITDKLANYRAIIGKMLSDLGKNTIETAVDLYTNKSMPLKVLAKWTGIPPTILCRELTKRGIEVDEDIQ